jgi:putative transposase
MSKFQNKYRNESARLQYWDYGTDAAYFVTICTAGREHYFGEISDSKQIELSEIGQFANKCWSEILTHFPFVVLDAFVVMPDHIHGIIGINKNNIGGNVIVITGTQNIASRPIQSKNKFGPQSQNLASIIRGFKIGITKYARIHKIEFCWQPRYHDHLIRNITEFERIRNYIIENPGKWNNDR